MDKSSCDNQPRKDAYGRARNRLCEFIFGNYHALAEERDVPRINCLNDHTDAFRHAFVSASLTCKIYRALAALMPDKQHALYLADVLADFIGFARKLRPSRSDVNMDLWNESVGRGIAIECMVNKSITRTTSKEAINTMLADRVAEAVKSGQTINDDKDDRRYTSRFNPDAPEKSLEEALMHGGKSPRSMPGICYHALRALCLSQAQGR